MLNQSLFNPGENCWRTSHADRVKFLVHGESYFSALYDTYQKARQQALFLCWDIDSKLDLLPGKKSGVTPSSTLDSFLGEVLTRQKQLRTYILSWDYAMIFATDREWLPILKLDWKTHRHLKFRLDSHHPTGACHHQKVVVLDDSLAFCGGLDLTSGRWDTAEHKPGDPRRSDAHGRTWQPYHDIQVMLSGDAAAAMGDLVRLRWQRGTSKKLAAPRTRGMDDLWPAGERFNADVEDVKIAIIRTEPDYAGNKAVREVEKLYLDSIAAAQRYIYIENQYFTATGIIEALAKRLLEEKGPEIVLVMPKNTIGWMSQKTMDVRRWKSISLLRDSDRYGRFTACYPDLPGLGDKPINVHAKAMVIDGEFVRVGSANLSRRSMSLDTECDIAFQSLGETRVEQAITGFRNRLLAEHLDTTEKEIAVAENETGSLLKAIESLNPCSGRCLKPLQPSAEEREEIAIAVDIADPDEQLEMGYILDRVLPQSDLSEPAWKQFGWLIVLITLMVLAAAWRWTPLNDYLDIERMIEIVTSFRGSPIIIASGLIIANQLVVPLTVLAIVSAAIFGPLYGFGICYLTALISAAISYYLGSTLGRETVGKILNGKINRISKTLAKRGIMTIITVRVVPVAPFSIVNLVAGASHISFRDYMIGNCIGLIPGLAAVTLLVDRFRASLESPRMVELLGLLGALVFFAIASYGLGYWLLRYMQGKKTEHEQGGFRQKQPLDKN